MSLSRNYFRLCSLTMGYEKENGKQSLLAVLPVGPGAYADPAFVLLRCHCGGR